MSVLSSTAGSLSSLVSTASSAPISVGGLVSGIDTSKVIQGILALDQRKVDSLASRSNLLQSKQTAFKSLEARLLALQTQMTRLARSQNGTFDARAIEVSDTAALTAAVSRTAVAGEYHLRVNRLAQAHQVASQGFDRVDSAVTQGIVSIKIGDVTTNLTIDDTNDTLQGLASAINASAAALTATVVNDGAGDDQQGYRLLLTAKATGVANQVILTNNLAASGGSAVKPLFDSGAISSAIPPASNSGTAAIQANAGAGYTGASNNVYTFTVIHGGLVGTDDGLQIAYTDATGANTGTITLDSGDVDLLKQVAQGIGVQFAAGTLVTGDTFTVKAFTPTVQAAADASITIGAGSGALTVSSTSNKVDALLPGVSLSLKQSDPDHDLTLTISNDINGITEGIQSFVNAYNDVVNFINQATSYDPETRQAGLLLGNSQVLSIQQQLRAVIQRVVPGANSGLSNLGGLGITTGASGQLFLDTTKLAGILNGGKPGVTLDDVRKLFALTGSSANSGIQFVSGSAKTRASTDPYAVHITQAAERAALIAPNALAASTVIDNTNNTLTVKVDGTTSGVLTLIEGTYSRAALAQALKAAINSDATLAARDVDVTLAGDNAAITSRTYGSASRLEIVNGSALAALGFVGAESAQGRDVAGNFVVGGVTEAAHGLGQFLFGNSGNINTDGLQVLVNLTPTQVGAGADGDVTITRGVAAQLDVVLGDYFDLENGRLKTIDDAFSEAIARLEDARTRATEFVARRQQQLQAQFSAMEQTLSQLQSAGNLLAQQAAGLTQKN